MARILAAPTLNGCSCAFLTPAMHVNHRRVLDFAGIEVAAHAPSDR